MAGNAHQRMVLSPDVSARRGSLPQQLLVFFVLGASCASARQRVPEASYEIRVADAEHERIAVRATVPSDGPSLLMAESRPGNVPELADAGWPALVKSLRVTDAHGDVVPVTGAGAGGWTMARSVTGPLKLEYEVNYAALAARGWPAPREAVWMDADHMIVLGRSLFITTPAQRESRVRFSLPRHWKTVAPWHGLGRSFTVATTADLTENLVAFLRGTPDVMTSAGFNLKVVTMGHWQPACDEVRRVLGAASKRLVAMIGFEGQGDYLVVLLPQVEDGGESFRASFALTLEADPSRANLDGWGNTIAHEVFHYWNGWRLKGADYASSQWFQEGFTEYAANLALVSSGLNDPERFYSRLAAHVTNYHKLETPLDAPGTHKGRPLYSGGALVAFTWDTMIREATDNEHGVFDVLHVLLRKTDDGAKRYAWPDIQAALESISSGSWVLFQRRYIHGTEPMPLDEALARVALRMSQTGLELRIEEDPAASASAVARRRALIRAQAN